MEQMVGPDYVMIALPQPLLNLNTKKYITYLHAQKFN